MCFIQQGICQSDKSTAYSLNVLFAFAALLAFAHLAQISKINDKIRLPMELSNVEQTPRHFIA